MSEVEPAPLEGPDAGLQRQVTVLQAEVAVLNRELDDLDDRLRRVVQRNQHVVRGWRLTMAVSLLGILFVTYVFSISENAPEVVVSVGRSFEFLDFLPIKLEHLLHGAGWFLAMLAAGMVVRSLPLLVMAAVLLALGGVVIELLQDNITLNRSSSLDDIVANCAGIALGFATILALRVGVYLSHPSRLKILGDLDE